MHANIGISQIIGDDDDYVGRLGLSLALIVAKTKKTESNDSR